MRFAFHLARTLGTTVGTMLDTMDADEWQGWLALHKIESEEAQEQRIEEKAKAGVTAARQFPR